jgi:hypothetical protein
MISLNIDGTEFTLQPENAENVRALCASIKAKGKGQKFKLGAPGLKMGRQYPTRAASTGEYVRQYEMLNKKIMPSCVARFAPLNDRPTTHYDPREPIVSEEQGF